MPSITPEIVEQMTGDFQRLLRFPAPEIVNTRIAHVICDAYRIYAIMINPGAVKSVTRSVFFGVGAKHIAADHSPNERYLLILRPQQSVDLRCGPAEGFNRGPAIIFVLSVDFGFNERIPIRRNTENMFTIIATEGPPIRLYALRYEMAEFASIQRVVIPSDSSVVLTLQPNVEYQITVETTDSNRDQRLQDPTTLMRMNIPKYKFQ